MIRYLTRDKINIEKYDHCVSNAVNSRIYALSWYLDIVADSKWDVLVSDDYAAVMPLPKRRKYFLDYIFLPPWSQQLGVFTLHDNDNELAEAFIDAIPKKFKFIEVFLNTSNRLTKKKFSKRMNYILPLNSSHETLFKNYKKGRKSSVKQAKNFNLKILEAYDTTKTIALFKANKGEELQEKIEYHALERLVDYGLKLHLVLSLGVINENSELIGGALFFKNNNRITYIFSSVNAEGRKKQAMSLLLDYTILKFSNDNYILDFEGSMMKKIALFFRSFGAVEEAYYHYKKYALW